MSQVQPFSYRIQIRLEPNWDAIIKRILGTSRSESFSELMAKAKNIPTIWNNIGRTYDFTEFFDSQSGLTIRFQRISTREISHGDFVDEFRDRSRRMFGSGAIVSDDEADKFSVEVTEYRIRKVLFHKVLGFNELSDRENFFLMPLQPILEFMITLQLLRPATKSGLVLKWPDQIEQSLQKNAIKYWVPHNVSSDIEPLEQEVPEFYRRYGRPQIAAFGDEPKLWFESECAHYGLEIETFTGACAARNSRLSGSSFFGNKSLWFD